MNFFSAFLIAVVALTGAVVDNVNAGPVGSSSSELIDVLKEFKELLPQEDLNTLDMVHLFIDTGFQDAVNYVQTDEFRDLVRRVNKIEDVINFYEYLVDAGFDSYAVVNELHDSLGLEHLTPRSRHSRAIHNFHIAAGADGYIADLRSIFPIDKIKALHQEKLKTSPAFARFIEHLKAPRFQELSDALRDNEEFQNLINTAKEGGIDVRAIADLLIDLWDLQFLAKTRV